MTWAFFLGAAASHSFSARTHEGGGVDARGEQHSAPAVRFLIGSATLHREWPRGRTGAGRARGSEGDVGKCAERELAEGRKQPFFVQSAASHTRLTTQERNKKGTRKEQENDWLHPAPRLLPHRGPVRADHHPAARQHQWVRKGLHFPFSICRAVFCASTPFSLLLAPQMSALCPRRGAWEGRAISHMCRHWWDGAARRRPTRAGHRGRVRSP